MREAEEDRQGISRDSSRMEVKMGNRDRKAEMSGELLLTEIAGKRMIWEVKG